MNENPTSGFPFGEAADLFKKGADLKSKGHFDAALTEFRRAVLADPSHLPALLEIGYLCRKKANTDPLFRRYSYEAFQKAARLDLSHEEAHLQYIMAGQQMGFLDDLLLEYQKWAQANQDNQLMQRCVKNIVTLSMAMVPQQVNIAGAKASNTWKMLVLLSSLAMIFIGLAMIFLPPLLSRNSAMPLSKEQITHFFRGGAALGLLGIGGFIVYSKIK